MKIKTKKQLNLPQLIEYAWENEIENKEYPCVGFESKTVIFNGIGWAEFSDEYSYNPTDIFTVEAEEEITEDTVIPRLVTRNTSGGYNEWGNECLNGFNLEYIKAIHILNDDLSLTLIWTHGKGLVD